MNLNELTKEADDLIRKVVSRYNTIYGQSGNFSQVELDLMLDDLRHLYEKFRLISQENLALNQKKEVVIERTPPTQRQPAPDKSVYEETKAAPAANLSPKPEPAQPAPAATASEGSIETISATTDSITNAPEQSSVSQATTATDSPAANPVLRQESPKPAPSAQSTEMIADRFKAIGKSISDAATEVTHESSIGEKLKYQKLADLKSAIGLYEKFNIINELFDGDQLAYEQAIVNLNGCTSLPDAEQYLAELKSKFNWPEESDTAARLHELLERKFL